MSFSAKHLPVIVCLQCILYLLQISLIECSSSTNSAAGSGGGVYGGRHSYSLSTFSPTGDIDQVVRAMRASVLGVPIVALSIPSIDAAATSSETGPTSDMQSSNTVSVSTSTANSSPQRGIYLSIPLRFLAASPFLVDDGTPRIVQLTSSLCVTHTGVGADGRALCDIAVKIALDYRYIYGEEISVEEMLEGLAEKVQEMTMSAGSRPFGCALLVGCLGSDDDKEPTMYRVDPSGAVALLNCINRIDGSDSSQSKYDVQEGMGQRGSVAFLGNWNPLRQKKDAIRAQLESQQFTNEEELRNALIDAAEQTYVDETSMTDDSTSQSSRQRMNLPVLFASFTRERGLQLSRIAQSQQ